MEATVVSSASAAKLEARQLWPRVWIYVGLSSDLPEPGNILPFTIGDAGLHVERLADGSLSARLNRAQQGGCLTIPQQCHGGTQLRCPQTACAFSRDRLAVIATDTPERDRLLRQFLGNRPDRLVSLPLRAEGSFMRILMREDAALASAPPAPPFSAMPGQSWWRELHFPWADLAHYLALTAERANGQAALHFPNLVLLTSEAWEVAMILQPLGPNLTRCRISLARGDRATIDALITQAANSSRLGSPSEEQPGSFLRQEIERYCKASLTAPPYSCISRSPHPTYGFIGG